MRHGRHMPLRQTEAVSSHFFFALVRLAPFFALAAFLLPVVLGLVGTLLPAFGWLPRLGRHELFAGSLSQGLHPSLVFRCPASKLGFRLERKLRCPWPCPRLRRLHLAESPVWISGA